MCKNFVKIKENPPEPETRSISAKKGAIHCLAFVTKSPINLENYVTEVTR